jgi:glyoxylase-like metal-dependent hydrolase (beta-lactamase superfamily II)
VAKRDPSLDAPAALRVHLLDVGPQEYSDALICEFGDQIVMIDGAHPGNHEGQEGHPSIPDQLDVILGPGRPHRIDLLIVTHAHSDHIGCLPRLVSDNVVQFRWALVSDPDLGWGNATDEAPDANMADARVRQLVAALRDECAPMSRSTPDARVAQVIADADLLEGTYRRMLTTLRDGHTRLVFIGRGDYAALEQEFASIGLGVLGPSELQALKCADLINGMSHDAAASVSDLFARDAALTPAQVYRHLVAGELDALDVSRPGPAVNLQSAVTTFEVGGHRFLFAGDMQFEDPQVNDDAIIDQVRKLRQAVSASAPFSLVKLSHHGSNNAFSEEILAELGGTVLFGICAGEHSTRHPNPATLRVLNRHRDEIRWARTDRNGHVTMTFVDPTPTVKVTKGHLNDQRPNSEDIALPGPVKTVSPVVEPPVTRVERTEVRVPSDFVEVTAKIPHTDTRVVITVEVSPGATGTGRMHVSGMAAGRQADSFRLADGRQLERLLFVTHGGRLTQNIGREETTAALAAIRGAEMTLCELPDGATDPRAAAVVVQQQLRGNPGLAGVVIVGGHDVVPLQSVDCLPADLRAQLGGSDDPDRFFVWSDDIYGDTDDDALPEVPVSRIPDGRSAELVLRALRAEAPDRRERIGLRNVARPFADRVYATITGYAPIMISEPTVFDRTPPINLDAGQIYLMLHGDYVDGTRFWGEGTEGDREAMNISNLSKSIRGVVFTGCCWGGLTTDTPAGMLPGGRAVGTKTPEQSIALSALMRGALAFVGCTGAHYSPSESPYDYFGGPMHRAFWRRYSAGASPAKALFDAKADFSADMPHGRGGTAQVAIEFKILRQYTCLGLGW